MALPVIAKTPSMHARSLAVYMLCILDVYYFQPVTYTSLSNQASSSILILTLPSDAQYFSSWIHYLAYGSKWYDAQRAPPYFFLAVMSCHPTRSFSGLAFICCWSCFLHAVMFTAKHLYSCLASHFLYHLCKLSLSKICTAWSISQYARPVEVRYAHRCYIHHAVCLCYILLNVVGYPPHDVDHLTQSYIFSVLWLIIFCAHLYLLLILPTPLNSRMPWYTHTEKIM